MDSLLLIVNAFVLGAGSFFFFFFNLFLAVLDLRCCTQAFCSCGEWGLLFVTVRCVCFSLQWLLLLQSMGSRCMGFSSCGARAQ